MMSVRVHELVVKVRWYLRGVQIKSLILFTMYGLVTMFVISIFYSSPADELYPRSARDIMAAAAPRRTISRAPVHSLRPQTYHSEITCMAPERTFMVRNLYIVDGAYHAFIGAATVLPSRCCMSENCVGSRVESITALLGIGFGGSVAELDLSEFSSGQVSPSPSSIVDETGTDAEKSDDDVIVDSGANGTSSSIESAHRLKIYVHRSDPPMELMPTSENSHIRYFHEPTIFFCTLWDNFFRTIYAGVGAWFTLMNYGIFFPHQHRFVLVAPSPDKFDHLLSIVTPNSLIRERDLLAYTSSDVESRVTASDWFDSENTSSQVVKFKAAIFGISKDVRVAEIEVESDRGWRYTMRSFALRSFCGKIKVALLDQAASALRGISPVHSTLSLPSPEMSATEDEFDEIYNKLFVAMNKRDNIKGQNSEQHHFIKVMNEAIVSSEKHLTRPADGKLRVSFIVREGGTRNIQNMKELLLAIKSRFKNIRVTAVTFESMSFEEQVEIVFNTDILISMHGAALAHTLFMRPDTYMIELFPYGFRKTIYQNLAKSMGVYYSFWENTHHENTRFDWNYVETHSFTNTTREEITRNSIDWRNMDSKNYWRNQDTTVQVDEFLHTLGTVLWLHYNSNNGRFLLYQPWEQINNQIIGFKSACAVAGMLDRVLVVPDFGIQSKESPGQYSWRPMFQYIDASTFVQMSSVCRFVSVANFVSLNQGKRIGNIRYHSLGDGSTSEEQLTHYIERDLKLEHEGLQYGSEFYYNTEQDIKSIHSTQNMTRGNERVLTLSSTFWYYDFGQEPPYGVSNSYRAKDDYIDFMQDEQYAYMMSRFKPHTRLQRFAEKMLQNIQKPHVFTFGGRRFPPLTVAMHVRRGDYLRKCEKQFLMQGTQWSSDVNDIELYKRCYPSDLRYSRIIQEMYREVELKKGSRKGVCSAVFYISTNDPSVVDRDGFLDDSTQNSATAETYRIASLPRLLPARMRDCVLYASELMPKPEQMEDHEAAFGFASIDHTFIDQWFAVLSDRFVGNLWSSFSRHIVEWRQLRLQKEDLMTSITDDVVVWT